MNGETIAILGLVGGFLGFVLAGAGTLWMALGKYALTVTVDQLKGATTELAGKVAKLEKEHDELDDRVQRDEVTTARLEGEVKVLEVKIGTLAAIESVTRPEFERQMEHLSSQLEDIKKELRSSPGRYRSASGPFTPPTGTSER